MKASNFMKKVSRIIVLLATLLFSLTDPLFSISGPQLLGILRTDRQDTFFGRRIIPVGDQNNDGFDDILISDNFRNLLFYGGNPFDSLATLFFDSTNARTNYVGDINGDGYLDFTAQGRSNYNWKLNLYYGGPLIDTLRDLWFGLDTLGPIGYSALGLDINGNGTNEIISWEGQNQYSALFNELGSDSDSIPDFQLFPANDSFAPSSHFARGLTSGDFNGDGTNDLAVSYNPSSSFSSNGAVYLYWGGIGFDTIPDLVLRRPGPYLLGGDHFGEMLENLEDVNGDTFVDLYVSSAGSINDTLGFVYFGGPGIDSIHDVIIPTYHQIGRNAFDINNDGFNDLIISQATSCSTSGWVELYLGGSQMDSFPDVRFDVRDEIGYHNYYGLDCAGIGDFNGDGIDDFAFSSGRSSGNFEVYVYSGWDMATDIRFDYEPTLPTDFILSQNYPNPFNPSTTIEFALPIKSIASLKIFNTLGKEVAVLLNKELSVGSYTVTWDGKDKKGNDVPSGAYYYRIEAGEFVESKKMLLVR